MPIESDGPSPMPPPPAGSTGNPRLFALIQGVPLPQAGGGEPKTGKSPTIWAWPQITEYLKVAAQPVAGPWPPHQEPRPDPEDEAGPVAIVEPRPKKESTQQPPYQRPRPRL